MDLLFTAVANIKTPFCIFLVAEPRLQSEPPLNKQTGNLIMVLIYGLCTLEINCPLTHGDTQCVETPSIKMKHTAFSVNENSVLDNPDCDFSKQRHIDWFPFPFPLCGRRSHSITFGVAVRDPCIAPSAWREAAWLCRSLPVRSVSDRWKERDRYSSCTQTFRR